MLVGQKAFAGSVRLNPDQMTGWPKASGFPGGKELVHVIPAVEADAKAVRFQDAIEFGKRWRKPLAATVTRNGAADYVRGSKSNKKGREEPARSTAPEKARDEADRKKIAELSGISPRHGKDLTQLSETMEARLTARKAQIKETYRARWNKLYERQGAEKDQGSQTRRSILDSFKGWISRRLEKTGVFVPFWLETSKGQAATAQTLDRKHKTERGEMAKQYRADLNAAVGEIKDAHRLSLRMIEMRQVGSGRTQDKAPTPPSREQFLKAVIDRQKMTPTANENQIKEPQKKRDREPGLEY